MGRLVRATTEQELVDAVRSADAAGTALLLVAGGSNLLVADEGFAGTVVRIETHGIEVLAQTAADVLVRTAAGHRWDVLVQHAVDAGWAGIEALSGIPGSVGATPIQNVGAYGAEVGQVLESVSALDRRTGEVADLAAEGLGLGYRTSTLKRTPGRWVILSVTLRLARHDLGAPVRYGELARTLGAEVGDRVPAAAVREAVLALRAGKGMVLDAADHDTWSAGSFFTNPVIPQALADALPPGAPRFAQPDGRVKTSAAWLISNAGFERGFRVRPDAPASLSTKHSLALTNRGTARCADVLELARAVRAGVAERFGIELEPEPVLVGCAL